MMGNIESKINKLKASVKEMDTGANMDTIMADALKSQQGFKKLQDQGLVTAATRELLQRDIKAGKIKLPKEIEDRIMLVEGDPGRVDPIQIFREQYGEDALEQVDSLVPDLAKAGSYKDLLNVVDKKYTIKPRSSTIPQTMSAEDAAKAEKDLGIKTLKDDIEDPEGFAVGGRVGMAKGGITALKTLINFLAKNRKNYFLEKNLGKVQGPTTGSKSLQALNPKSLGYKQNFLTKEMDQQYLDNRIDYFKNLQNVIKNDRELLINMKALPKEHQDKFYKMINEGGNKGRLDIYNKIDIDDAIMDIEQIIKNAEFKNLSEEAVKRKLNSEGGSQGLDYLMGIERQEYAGGSGYFSNLIKENIPPEYRLYAKSILPGGKKGDVDESYFKEDFKQDLRQQALTKFKETGELKGSIGELDTHYRSGAKKYGQGEKYPINKLIGLPSTYASLGSYNYEIDPNTLDVKVKDTYDWNPAYGKNPNGKTGWVGNKKGKDVNAGMLKNYLMEAIKTGEIDKGDALELIGNYFGPKASRGEGINVDIDIPTQDLPMGEGETFATGGRVGYAGGGGTRPQGLNYLMGY
jgi:hypothetical protein